MSQDITKATFAPGDRIRIRGSSSEYGTVVVRPFGSAVKSGVPVVFDGDEGISFALAERLDKIHHG